MASRAGIRPTATTRTSLGGQPNSSSITLNRVIGGFGPSMIYGMIDANGRVFIINRDGILFGPNAVVNTSGFLATTNDIRNQDFMAGRFNFTIPGRPDASIVNLGTITAHNGGFAALNTKESPYGKIDKRVYSDLVPGDHPIEMTRYQLANCYMGRMPLINSGGASGKNDTADAFRTAVINKRAGGMGLISGRKAFQRPMAEGVKLLNLIQDVYLDQSITIA